MAQSGWMKLQLLGKLEPIDAIKNKTLLEMPTPEEWKKLTRLSFPSSLDKNCTGFTNKIPNKGDGADALQSIGVEGLINCI